jgi:hypothetical protein
MPFFPIPSDVARFVLTSIPSVPYLEAMLLLRQESGVVWDAKEVGRRLYIMQTKAEMLLDELTKAGILVRDDDVPAYRYSPVSVELSSLIDKLAVVYAKHIIEVSNLIHTKSGTQVQQFADAFKLRKDS